ncbi:hypothetical protein C8J56DRAFT_802642, partial [Mycena floridula]
GAYVRYLIGNEKGKPVYRICRIKSKSHSSLSWLPVTVLDVGPDFVEPYPVGDKSLDQHLLLQHGKSIRAFPITNISNSAFEQNEFEQLIQSYGRDGIPLPSKENLKMKEAQIVKLTTQPVSEVRVTLSLILFRLDLSLERYCRDACKSTSASSDDSTAPTTDDCSTTT